MNRIENENIRDKLEASPIEGKMLETHLRGFGHVQWRSIDATVRKSDSLEAASTSRM